MTHRRARTGFLDPGHTAGFTTNHTGDTDARFHGEAGQTTRNDAIDGGR